MGRYPRVFFPIARWVLSPVVVEECLFSSDKELVIEGFPRSANTFSVVAFRQAQQRHVPMAHHLHVEAQIIQGVRKGKPVIVLIRNPVDAVKSLLIRHQHIDPAWAFRRYYLFYKTVLRLEEHVVIADFSAVTSDFGSVIRRVNKKFGTYYDIFQHTKENVANVFRDVELINDRLDNGKESHVARPSKRRSEIKVDINEQNAYVANALEIYERLSHKN